MKRNFLLLVFSIIIFSCGNDDDTAPNTSINSYVGTWKWVSTNGGIGDNIHDTPSSTGHNASIEIQQNQNMVIYKDDVLIANNPFIISQVTSIYNGQSMPYIDVEVPENFNDPGIVITGIIEVSSNGQLIISDNNHDGVISTYSRID